MTDASQQQSLSSFLTLEDALVCCRLNFPNAASLFLAILSKFIVTLPFEIDLGLNVINDKRFVDNNDDDPSCLIFSRAAVLIVRYFVSCLPSMDSLTIDEADDSSHHYFIQGLSSSDVTILLRFKLMYGLRHDVFFDLVKDRIKKMQESLIESPSDDVFFIRNFKPGIVRTKPKRPSTFKRAIIRERPNSEVVLTPQLNFENDLFSENNVNTPCTGLDLSPLPLFSPIFLPIISHRNLTTKVSSLLTKLNEFQIKKIESNPLKAKLNKRLLLGLKEVKRSLLNSQCQLLVLAVDLENSNSDNNPLSNLVNEFIEISESKQIPYCFAGSRKFLCKIMGRTGGFVSAISVINVDPLRKELSEIIDCINQSKIDAKILIDKFELL
ncbi:hypothetical protein RCL1_006540 [Eukaryota sp. TZLM3-RCL]